MAVLRLNIIKVKNGPEKIDRGEFVIEEASSKRRIDLTMDWELCFLPGQKVLMSMVFHRSREPCSACPNCGTDCHGPNDEERECPSCGVTFHNVHEMNDMALVKSRTQDGSSTEADGIEALTLGPNRPEQMLEPEEHEDDMGPFRRVQIRTPLKNVEANMIEASRIPQAYYLQGRKNVSTWTMEHFMVGSQPHINFEVRRIKVLRITEKPYAR